MDKKLREDASMEEKKEGDVESVAGRGMDVDAEERGVAVEETLPEGQHGKGARVLSSCEGFPNIPLMGMRGCINYNPVLAIRQLGCPIRRAPSEESITPFIARGFSDPNARMLQRVQKAWNVV